MTIKRNSWRRPRPCWFTACAKRIRRVLIATVRGSFWRALLRCASAEAALKCASLWSEEHSTPTRIAGTWPCIHLAQWQQDGGAHVWTGGGRRLQSLLNDGNLKSSRRTSTLAENWEQWRQTLHLQSERLCRNLKKASKSGLMAAKKKKIQQMGDRAKYLPSVRLFAAERMCLCCLVFTLRPKCWAVTANAAHNTRINNNAAFALRTHAVQSVSPPANYNQLHGVHVCVGVCVWCHFLTSLWFLFSINWCSCSNFSL